MVEWENLSFAKKKIREILKNFNPKERYREIPITPETVLPYLYSHAIAKLVRGCLTKDGVLNEECLDTRLEALYKEKSRHDGYYFLRLSKVLENNEEGIRAALCNHP